MWNIPKQSRLDRIPRLYETDDILAAHKMIHLHFFIGGSDWYICEYDGDDLFYGFAILNQDYEMAEWGYISFEELKSIKIPIKGLGSIEIDCEKEEFFPVQPAGRISRIRQCPFSGV